MISKFKNFYKKQSGFIGVEYALGLSILALTTAASYTDTGDAVLKYTKCVAIGGEANCSGATGTGTGTGTGTAPQPTDPVFEGEYKPTEEEIIIISAPSQNLPNPTKFEIHRGGGIISQFLGHGEIIDARYDPYALYRSPLDYLKNINNVRRDLWNRLATGILPKTITDKDLRRFLSGLSIIYGIDFTVLRPNCKFLAIHNCTTTKNELEEIMTKIEAMIKEKREALSETTLVEVIEHRLKKDNGTIHGASLHPDAIFYEPFDFIDGIRNADDLWKNQNKPFTLTVHFRHVPNDRMERLVKGLGKIYGLDFTYVLNDSEYSENQFKNRIKDIVNHIKRVRAETKPNTPTTPKISSGLNNNGNGRLMHAETTPGALNFKPLDFVEGIDNYSQLYNYFDNHNTPSAHINNDSFSANKAKNFINDIGTMYGIDFAHVTKNLNGNMNKESFTKAMTKMHQTINNMRNQHGLDDI